ncbi:hypothetical protein T08_3586 [Trichinella sp. T8]|nr:hypothetical protein T08_3586 [Trichinella sp. T8]
MESWTFSSYYERIIIKNGNVRMFVFHWWLMCWFEYRHSRQSTPMPAKIVMSRIAISIMVLELP